MTKTIILFNRFLIQLDIFKFLKSQVILSNFAEDIKKIADALLVLIPSSAGLERIFNTLGFVHDETGNRLSIEKANKIAFCLRLLQ